MQSSRRTFIERGIAAAAAAVIALPLAGCTGDAADTDDSPAVADDGAAIVEVGPGGRYEYTPGTTDPLRIDAETVVRFVWQSNTHNVHVTDQPDGADWPGHDTIENKGFEYEYEFTVPGTYEYVCTPHEGLGMVATIVVEE